MTSVRGILIGAIYHKSLKMGSDELANAAAVTLMSTDVNGVERLITLAYESWARLIEIGSGIGILGKFIGPSCVFTLIPAIGKSLQRDGPFCLILTFQLSCCHLLFTGS